MQTKSSVHLPAPAEVVDPLRLLTKRVIIAVGVLVLTALLVYLDREGYTDNSDGSVDLLDAFYYTTVSLSTTGYGDITPTSDSARLVNIVLITPLRVLFLIVLIGTTLETLTTRSREQVRLNRWRKKLRDHTVVIGYGVKGRSAVATMLANGMSTDTLVVVDPDPAAIAEANEQGLVAVMGDATRTEVLRRAGVPAASRIVITTARDDASVLATLTCRQLNQTANIVVSVREADNLALVRQGGANEVVTSSDAVGRILGLATVSPALGHVLEDLTTSGVGLEVAERLVSPREEGKQPRQVADLVVAVVRDGDELPFHSPAIGHLVRGDRLIVIRPSEEYPWARREDVHEPPPVDEPEDPADRPPGGV
ncbi:TrkA family potassium uptake protein [Jiangella sp. DSM 45060]|uniref:potassium channel family protein n=1 Tax=Jiangella sp. DSM 45060 TaxID=1798224 RepID=UPI00087D72B9|nr:potassium channel family protein [Jiangella sp. DSM 45060]SDT69887.1 voltage-gated potassium channel [Jiangella sp. DSM 45060]